MYIQRINLLGKKRVTDERILLEKEKVETIKFLKFWNTRLDSMLTSYNKNFLCDRITWNIFMDLC